MSNVTFGIAVFGSMLTLMVLRAPISLSMFLPGAVAYWYLAGDSALRRRLGASARARVVERYSWACHCEQLERVLLRIAA